MKRRGDAAMLGGGVAACAACCAGPIAAALGAIGLGTALGAAIWGAGVLVVGAVAAFVLVRRRRRSQCSTTPATGPVAVAAPILRRQP